MTEAKSKTVDIFDTGAVGSGVFKIDPEVYHRNTETIAGQSKERVIQTYRDPEINNPPFHHWLDERRDENCVHCHEPHTLITHWSGCDGRPPVRLISGLFAQPHVWRKNQSCRPPLPTRAHPNKSQPMPGSNRSRKPTTRGTSSAGSS